MIQSKNLTFVDIFTGSGGLSLGLLQAGLKGLFAVEKDVNAFETLSYNLISGRTAYQFNWPDRLPIKAYANDRFGEAHQ